MQRKVKEILPKTFDELKALPQGERARLWARHSPHPFKRQMRPLWYYIQCERLNLRIEPKFIKKIKKSGNRIFGMLSENRFPDCLLSIVLFSNHNKFAGHRQRVTSCERFHST